MRLKLLLFSLSLMLSLNLHAQLTEYSSPPVKDWYPHNAISYSYFTEDRMHPCNHESYNNNYDPSECATYDSDGVDFSLDRPGYRRGCLYGIGNQCSSPDDKTVHLGWDYDHPYHNHPQEFWVDDDNHNDSYDEPHYHSQYEDGIYPVASGEVVFVHNDYGVDTNGDSDRGFGKTVIIRHICINDPHNLCVWEGNEKVIYTQYSHLDKIMDGVNIGTPVSKGYQIGKIGGSANNLRYRWLVHIHLEFKTFPALVKVPCPNGRDAKGYLKLTNNYANNNQTFDCGYRDPKDFLDDQKVLFDSHCTERGGGPDEPPNDFSWMIPIINYYLND